MRTAIEFVIVWLVGWFGSLILLVVFEDEHPKCQDTQIEKQIKRAMKTLSFRAGLIVATVWLLYRLIGSN